MAKKGVAIKKRLVSSGKNTKGEPTGTLYYTKTSKHAEGKLAKRKYDPKAVHPETGKPGCHVLFTEKKMPPSKKN